MTRATQNPSLAGIFGKKPVDRPGNRKYMVSGHLHLRPATAEGGKCIAS